MTTAITRLHISPLNSDLLHAVLGTEISKVVTNVSYHTLETFPDNSYGYVDLPQMEADKVKKKINGAIVKGRKIRIEEARPKKRKTIEGSSEEVSQVEQNSDSSDRARKRSRKEKNVIPGHELSPGRKVKRGWTENKSEKLRKKKDKSKPTTKPQAASKYTDKEELLFRTRVPKNKTDLQAKEAKRKDKSEVGGEVVHEFEKSTAMPSFLRQETPNNKSAVEYKDGEGWIDSDGNIVEKEDVKAFHRRTTAKHGIESEVVRMQPATTAQLRRSAKHTSRPDSNESSSSTSVSSSDNEEELDKGNLSQDSAPNIDIDETSSSGSSTTDSSSEISSNLSEGEEQTEVSKLVESITEKPSLHPLEALFKKPTKPASSQATGNSQDVVKPSLEVQTSFSFFASHDDDNDGLPPMPMTPFSSQDLRRREIRSAAPTPDTANPSRMGSVFNGEEPDKDLSETGDSSTPINPILGAQQRQSSSQSLQIPQTDFEKQFWEKRGENNRAWKARRRAVLKEKRQRDNRARRPKNW